MIRRAAGAVAGVLALSVTFAVAVTAAAPAPARAATSAACTGKTGVTVVVDFTRLHGKVRVGCAGSKPGTGLAALKQAGFGYTFVPRIPGFVCTIDKLPRHCNGAPATAYWSYWHAAPHGKWKYSSVGAASYHPKAGSVEGWAFGAGKPPHLSPP